MFNACFFVFKYLEKTFLVKKIFSKPFSKNLYIKLLYRYLNWKLNGKINNA